MEKISIIVPAYNVEDYIRTCLDSLIAQDYENIEIIVINDGSKDDTLKIARAYERLYTNIKVIDKENEGVSIARNVGLEAATGEYIAFIDPDDWAEPNMYSSLLNSMKKYNSPICLCNFYRDKLKRKNSSKSLESNEETKAARIKLGINAELESEMQEEIRNNVRAKIQEMNNDSIENDEEGKKKGLLARYFDFEREDKEEKDNRDKELKERRKTKVIEIDKGDFKIKSQPKYFEFIDDVLYGDSIIENLVNPMIGLDDLLPKYVYVMGSVWRGLYQKSFIDENNIRFMPNVTIMEDLIFMVQMLLKTDVVAIDQGVYYHYIQRSDSAVHAYNENLWEDQVAVYNELVDSIKEANLEEQMKTRLETRYLGMLFNAIRNETCAKDADLKTTLGKIKELFNAYKQKEE